MVESRSGPMISNTWPVSSLSFKRRRSAFNATIHCRGAFPGGVRRRRKAVMVSTWHEKVSFNCAIEMFGDGRLEEARPAV